MKHTAVDWLIEEYINGAVINIQIMKKALEMEKEQIMDAYNSDRPNLCAFTEGTAFKEYYKKTYKKK